MPLRAVQIVTNLMIFLKTAKQNGIKFTLAILCSITTILQTKKKEKEGEE